ncbi:MAG TPA: glycosyltransferase [Gemmatimonadales bacterium]|nr:glycosyltransferase [Gemmatimonadales bacterium]
MTDLVLLGALALWVYSYAGYPALLWLASRRRTPRPEPGPVRWPAVSIVLPVHNEAAQIAEVLERILALDYAGPRQIVVVSDASTDMTDEIVQLYAARGVELIRLPSRRGKSAAENAALGRLTGHVIVNTDASVRVERGALRALMTALADPHVGVASGRDVSVSVNEAEANRAEAGYVGFEMWIRDLETRLGGIVGASGCLYAIRAELHREAVGPGLSRDFAAALRARARGYRAVSVPGALCVVPRAPSLHQEYRRKVRTVTRGLATLLAYRRLLNPLRYGGFAWMLASHKLCRWLAPVAAVAAAVALAGRAAAAPWARVCLAAGVVIGLLALLGWTWRARRELPRALAVITWGVAANVAVLYAWLRLLAGRRDAVWEPTRRAGLPAAAAPQHHRHRAQHDLEVLQR